ncbi:MAG: flagellar basal-body MS-ring/collar protein FliF [Pseudomonadales bacterium]
MATLPATSQASPETVTVKVPAGNSAFQGFSNVGIFRQIGLLVGLAASIAIGFAVVLWSQEPEYTPLLANMQNIDANDAVNILQSNEIPYKIDSRSGGLLVASDQLHAARMKLASVGITDNRSVGFELLDREQGLGTSQFMENISYRRGLEGELARTISSLQSVRAARVHLGLPKSTVFVRDARKPTASVFVDLMSGRSLKDTQVSAITNLVASSVPELDPLNVTIVDQNGRLLSNQGETEDAAMAAHQFEYTRKLEGVLADRVEGILLPVIGADKFRTEVSADVDFTAQEETQEAYDPELQVLRSEQTLEEQRSGLAGAGGVPGALSNQPPGGVSVPEVATGGEGGAVAANTPQNRRTQATRNYELDRKISYTKYQQGQVRRLSVAVVIDNVIPAGGDEPAPWAEADIERLTNLVKGAVGYDEARGDSVTVINAPFTPVEVVVPEAVETPIWEQAWFMKLVKQVLAGLLVLILVFAVIRPIMKSLAVNGQQQKALAEATARAEAAAKQAESMAAAGPMAAAQFNPHAQQQGGAMAMLPGPGQADMSLSTVQNMIDNDPQRAAQVVKQWVKDNE